MFGKKLLSIVGLLFVGSKLASAESCTYSDISMNDGNPVCGNDCTVADKIFLVHDSSEGHVGDYAIDVSTNPCQVKNFGEDVDVCVSDHVITDKGLKGFCDGNCNEYKTCHTNGKCVNAIIEARSIADITKCKPGTEKPSDDIDTTPSAYHCDPGYYITQEGGSFFQGTVPNSNPAVSWSDDNSVPGKLYLCTKDGETTCQQILSNAASIGYYKSANPSTNDDVKYIKCDGNECKPVFGALPTQCTVAEFGKLVKTGTNLELCTKKIADAYGAIELKGNSEIKYFLPVRSTSGTVFDSKAVNGYSIVVEIDKDKAVIAAKGGKKYRFTDADNKIYDSPDSSTICNADPEVNAAYEYVLYKEPSGAAEEDTYDYYKSDGVNLNQSG